jgi:hypothetical protein
MGSDMSEAGDGQQQIEILPDDSPEAVDVSKPAKLMRLGAMTREMLEELRRAPLDEQGRKRMRDIYDRSIEQVKDILSPELQEELSSVSIPFEDPIPSESELRIAQAQLMGWLEGLFRGIQAALWAQHIAAQQQATQFPRALQAPPGRKDNPSGYL